MGHDLSSAYASSINAIILVTLLISSSADDITYVDKDFFRIDDASNYLFGVCLYESGNYTKPSEYESNLLSLFSNLTATAVGSMSTVTLSKGTAGSGSNNKAYGSFDCLEPDFCGICVETSTKILLDRCQTMAGIVYNVGYLCQVSYYANTSSLLFDENNDTTITTSITICEDTAGMPDPANFNKTVVMSFERLISEVESNSASDYYALDTISDLYIGQNVSTFIRCLPGVSTPQCKNCLLQALNHVERYCLSQAKAAAFETHPSCQVRYNVFWMTSSPPTLPLPQSPHSSPDTSASPGMLTWLVSPTWIIAATIFDLICNQGLRTGIWGSYHGV